MGFFKHKAKQVALRKPTVTNIVVIYWYFCYEFDVLTFSGKKIVYTQIQMVPIYSYILEIFIFVFQKLLLKDHSLLVLGGWKELIELGPSGIIHYLLIFSFYLLLIFFVYMYFFSLVFLCGAATSTILFLSFSLLYIPSIIMLFQALPYQSVARSGN